MNNYITVFTPTYNRSSLLKRCFDSLVAQTSYNFVWLIIDDGSTDDTKSVVDHLKNISSFKIEYYYKENGGKPSAHNFALDVCSTDYFLILDSDDILDSNAIDILSKKIELIKNRDDIAGIIGNRGKIGSNDVIGSPMPNLMYAKGIELYQKYHFTGDTLRLYKTKVLKDYPFPLIEGEKFVPENIVFDAIDSNYDLLVIKEVLYLGEYQENGYSKRINLYRHNNPIGYSLSLKSAAETAVVLKKKINWTILFIIWTKSFKLKSFSIFKYKLRYILLLPVSYCFMFCKKPSFLFDSILLGDDYE